MDPINAPDIDKLRTSRNVRGLIKALQHKDAAVRQKAARSLGVLRASAAVAPLIVALGDPDEPVVIAAAQSLGVIKDQEAVAPLIKSLADEREWVYRSAAESLGRIGDPQAAEPLIETLTQKPAAANEAAWALGRLKDNRAVPPLIDLLWHDNASVRVQAITALGEIGDSRAAAPLVTIYRTNEDGFTRVPVREALEKLPLGLVDNPTRAWIAVILGDWQAAAGFGADAVDPLIAALSNRLVNNGRMPAATTLAKIGDKKAIIPLIDAYQQALDACRFSNSIEECDEIARALEMLSEGIGRIEDERVINILVRLLKDAFLPARKTAAYVLMQIGEQVSRSVSPLTRDQDESVRENALAILKKVNPSLLKS
jgi:HEAT repeat protein